MITLIFIGLVGKLFIFLVQQLPPVHNMKQEFFHKLFNCDLCLGVWVFFSLCGFFHFELVSEIVGIYVPLINEIITGAIISFLVHLMSLGWKIKFSEFTIME